MPRIVLALSRLKKSTVGSIFQRSLMVKSLATREIELVVAAVREHRLGRHNCFDLVRELGFPVRAGEAPSWLAELQLVAAHGNETFALL